MPATRLTSVLLFAAVTAFACAFALSHWNRLVQVDFSGNPLRSAGNRETHCPRCYFANSPSDPQHGQCDRCGLKWVVEPVAGEMPRVKFDVTGNGEFRELPPNYDF